MFCLCRSTGAEILPAFDVLPASQDHRPICVPCVRVQMVVSEVDSFAARLNSILAADLPTLMGQVRAGEGLTSTHSWGSGRAGERLEGEAGLPAGESGQT